jgi:hypothetical protein
MRLHRHVIGVALALGAAARFDTAFASGFIDHTTLLPLDAAMFRLLVSG